MGCAQCDRPWSEHGEQGTCETLGRCQLCGSGHRRVHREAPNRFVAQGLGFIWVCRRCGRMNTAINSGKAICCTEPGCEGYNHE